MSARRVVRLRVAGQEMVAVVEDVPRLRDGLGVPVPPGVAAAFADEPSSHPIQDLVLRWGRTHGPFTASAVARRYGLGRAVVEAACTDLVRSGQLVRGSYVDPAPGAVDEDQFCHTQVLALIKRRSLAALRREVEPVEQVAYARFLTEWQGVGSRARGTDAVLSVLEQLAGYAMPASAVESMILPARVEDYRPAMLDELTSAGEVFWVGDGADRRQRRLGSVPPAGRRSADRARRDRVGTGPSAAGVVRARRRLLLRGSAARRRRGRPLGLGGCAVAAGLGRSGQQRHVHRPPASHHRRRPQDCSPSRSPQLPRSAADPDGRVVEIAQPGSAPRPRWAGGLWSPRCPSHRRRGSPMRCSRSWTATAW